MPLIRSFIYADVSHLTATRTPHPSLGSITNLVELIATQISRSAREYYGVQDGGGTRGSGFTLLLSILVCDRYFYDHDSSESF